MRYGSGTGSFERNVAAVFFGVLLLSAGAAKGSPTQEGSAAAPCTDYRVADAEMSLAYREVLALYKGDQVFIPAFRKSQRAWLAYRNAHLDALYPEAPATYGSVLPTCRCLALTELTLERTAVIRRWLTGTEEGDVCSGSIRLR